MEEAVYEKGFKNPFWFNRKDPELIPYGDYVVMEPGGTDYARATELLGEQREQALAVVKRDTGKEPVRIETGIVLPMNADDCANVYWIAWVEK